ncbi:pseudouridine synthase [Aquincola tertiaricarbonis]|uniref:Dual-specificity RNA pseudouridine synthase RluF n=1 Tax=Aquincola tertiaricarbonis TaxID=391953 RepID=A0ABY4SHP6_AQUTE|nr:pseudouridine synthase [Aquincola tertiaricarbonis]URI11657.1 pseudouridine synthase [Aquincola tertiaricarbonis]
MATLKLKNKPAAAGSGDRARAPLRAATAPRRQRTLAEAQAERAAREEAFRQQPERGGRGERPHRDGPPGDRPRRAGPPGERPRFERGGDDRPHFDRPRGDRPQGDRPSGDRPRFDRPRDDRPQGDRPAFDRPRGDRPDRPYADRPRGDRPYGDRPRGDRPDRPPGDRPRFDRPRSDAPRVDRPREDRGPYDRPHGDRPRPDRGGERGFDRPRGEGWPGERGGDRRPSFDRPQRPAGDRPPRFQGERPPRQDHQNRPDRPAPLPPASLRPPEGGERPRRSGPEATSPRAAEGERLSKRLTAMGLASRREADDWIDAGWVRVDGQMAVLGQRVRADARIEIDPAAHKQQAQRMTVILHKPVGYVSGQAEDGYEPAVVLVKPENRWSEDASGVSFHPGHLRSLVPAGRLDIDSTGLLVLTQDGRVAKQLIGEDSNIEKEYLVRVEYVGSAPDGRLPEADLDKLRHGLWLDEVKLQPAKVSWQNEDQLRVVLREGRKRQIRRMCEAVGLKVVGLKRVRIGSVVLGQLPPGQWRYLRRDERF